MEFCTKCGNLLRPVKEVDKTYLLCPNCGKKHKLSKKNDYTIVRTIEHNEGEKLEVTEIRRRRALTEEEREELEDSYGDLLEQMDVD
ncbi:MAG: hypothetical protein U9O98_07075 [Asgard group archaeon]|nr:hypothetical protein [Asgard group archaeon]